MLVNGLVVIPTARCSWEVDRHLNVGVNAFHVHINALGVAWWRNQQAGFKITKVVVERQHFVLVDHTWERNE